MTKGALFANLQAIASSYNATEEWRAVTWLPPYHDMGLVGGLLAPLFWGSSVCIMRPELFLSRPANWLRAISAFRARFSAAPNFAYDYCARRIPDGDLLGVDLSCWAVAVNGAEPVRNSTMDRFSERFQHVGFDPVAFRPSYGLAEATLLVSAGQRVEEPSPAPYPEFPPDRLVSCGPPAKDIEVQIVSPDGVGLTEGRLGEVWVRGPSVAAGYWRNETETRSVFGATLGDRVGFLRTGDTGFMFDGRLYITGRVKDVIVARGRSIHALDVEDSVLELLSDPKAVCAAFVIESEMEELLCVAIGVRPTTTPQSCMDELAARSRSVIRERLGVTLSAVIFTTRNGIPKTSSGKVRRQECRNRLMSGETGVIFAWTTPAARKVFRKSPEERVGRQPPGMMPGTA